MNNLRQCFNNMTAVGTLKSKEVKYSTTSNGEPTISLNLILVSKNEDKINETRINLWAKNTSKLYNSYVTVANEYKTIEKDGEENADRVKITGNLEMNEYFNSNSMELKTFNNLKGVFVNRLNTELQDEIGAVVECIITGTTDEISSDGMPTGRKKVQLMTVGYGSTIHEIQNVVVSKELAQQFTQIYPINSTGKLYLKIHNYAEVEEVTEKPVLGFGTNLNNMPDSVVKNYVNEIEIIGGDAPNVANRFTLEQINEMKKQRELARNEKMNKVPQTPPAPTGFGSFGQPDVSNGITEDTLPF